MAVVVFKRRFYILRVLLLLLLLISLKALVPLDSTSTLTVIRSVWEETSDQIFLVSLYQRPVLGFIKTREKEEHILSQHKRSWVSVYLGNTLVHGHLCLNNFT